MTRAEALDMAIMDARDVLEWLETGGAVQGVGFDEAQIIDRVREMIVLMEEAAL